MMSKKGATMVGQGSGGHWMGGLGKVACEKEVRDGSYRVRSVRWLVRVKDNDDNSGRGWVGMR